MESQTLYSASRLSLDGYALITGAGSGIGLASALAYTQAGADGLALVDINEKRLEEAEIKCKNVSRKECFEVISLCLDVTSESQVEDMVSKTIKRFGRIDYATNAAGILAENNIPISEVSGTSFDRVMDVNTRAIFYCVREEAKAMKIQEPTDSLIASFHRPACRGSIVNIASVAGLRAVKNCVPYVASKHAVIGITKAAALDHAADGIRINVICPGWVDTPLLNGLGGEGHDITSGTKKYLEKTVPMRRLALAEEIADFCVVLSSHVSSYMTGAVICLDGGVSLSSA